MKNEKVKLLSTLKLKGYLKFVVFITETNYNVFFNQYWNGVIKCSIASFTLRMDLPAGTSVIGFADDALVVCAAEDVGILKLRINESLWRAKRWLDSRGLKMAAEKTEALLVTERKSFSTQRLFLGNTKTCGKRVLSTCGDTNVELTWLRSCPTLVDPGKPREDWWRAWCTQSCCMQLRSGQVPSATMLSKKSCSQHREKRRWE